MVALVGILFSLSYIAIVKSGQRDAEKKRGDTLQQGIDSLRDRSEQDRSFFEIVRKLITAQGAEEKQALIDQLRGFKFSEPATTTTTLGSQKAPRSTSTTTTTPKSSPTTAPRPPPSTTTTTAPPSPPPSRPCVTTPVINVCPPTASSNERKPS